MCRNLILIHLILIIISPSTTEPLKPTKELSIVAEVHIFLMKLLGKHHELVLSENTTPPNSITDQLRHDETTIQPTTTTTTICYLISRRQFNNTIETTKICSDNETFRIKFIERK